MVYDRAVLTALPDDIRKLYVAQFQLIVSESTNVFLLTTEDVESNEDPAQICHVGEEVDSLHSGNFGINLAHVESVLEFDAVKLSDRLQTFIS